MNDETTDIVKNYFVINRKLFDNYLWKLEPFTKAQAWIDMIGNANYMDGEMQIRGIIIPIKRGQLGWSELTMSNRWKWSREKVRRFLSALETRQQIRQQKNFQTSITTILNYTDYQLPIQQMRQQTVQQKDSRRDTTNKDKNEKNINTNTKYSSLEKINSSDKDEIAKTYGVSLATVEDELENLKLYCESKGVSYRNYKAALINFIKRSKRTTSNNATLII